MASIISRLTEIEDEVMIEQDYGSDAIQPHKEEYEPNLFAQLLQPTQESWVVNDIHRNLFKDINQDKSKFMK